MQAPEYRHHGLKPGTYILALAQAVNLTAAVIAVTIAALAGTHLATSRVLGTVPYGAQFASIMLCTYPASILMRRIGRRPVFCIGGTLLIAAGAVGYLAIVWENFYSLIVAHTLLGSFAACANFYRFAAVDDLPSALKAKAISMVVAGGVIAAISGPAISEGLQLIPGFPKFSLCYGALAVLGICTLVLMSLWHPDSTRPDLPLANNRMSRPARQKLDRAIPVAIAAAGGSYLVMNLLMVQASLVMADLCSFASSSRAIQAHVLAMFAPSFITGGLIARFGPRKVLLLGCGLLATSAIFNVLPLSYPSVLVGLVLLGLGWNFLYVGGGALLANHLTDESQHRWQGINDTTIAACATIGAFLPSVLLSIIGWQRTNLGIMVFVLGLALISLLACAQLTVMQHEGCIDADD